jgi:toxin-antitoxin system PIN domain toxin
VILIDTNLLIYAINADSPQHKSASSWLGGQFGGAARVGLPWHSLLGFVRLVSDRKIHKTGSSAAEAWDVVRKWLSVDNVWIPLPTDRHSDVLNGLFAMTNVGSRDVMDMHLAALAMEHDLTLCSADGDFARYPNLKWLNPLVA